ncbi:26S proteasome non-ATPase regulatory subunit 10 [Durusdinium trenchii]|uniref:26S proteasome non-ATPase regulatory subunit 10 n=1 Tax=Durusdinium trenchii TaxID=1381693 RepID=A0ABP0HUY8_9DINO
MECPSHAAWLAFRSPEDEEAGCWQHRWVVLQHSGVLTLFQDESCKRSIGRLELQPNARVLTFADPRAPNLAAKLRGHRPHGFLLELNPLDAEDYALPSGEFRQLLMFEAADAEELEAWLEVFSRRQAMLQVPVASQLPFAENAREHLLPTSNAHEFDIDDFSDYEDDTHARASSLHALDKKDWTSPTARRVYSRPRRGPARSPIMKGETSGDEAKTSCSSHAEVMQEDEDVY